MVLVGDDGCDYKQWCLWVMMGVAISNGGCK